VLPCDAAADASGLRPGWPRTHPGAHPRPRRSTDRGRALRPPEAPGATGRRARRCAPGGAPRAGGAPGPPGSCQRSDVAAGRKRPRHAREGGVRRDGQLAAPAQQGVPAHRQGQRLAAAPPALPPRATPRATRRWASRSVRRVQGATTGGRRSVKMRRRQGRLRQNPLRTRSWRRTGYSAQGRAARGRSSWRWMRCAGVVQSGQGPVGWGERTRRVSWAAGGSTVTRGKAPRGGIRSQGGKDCTRLWGDESGCLRSTLGSRGPRSWRCPQASGLFHTPIRTHEI